MHEVFEYYKVGIIGDSHLMRMKPYIPSHVRVLGRGGERAHNGLRYRKYFDGLDIIVIFLGGNEVTGKDGAESPSTITEFVDDIKAIAAAAKEMDIHCLTVDLVPREANPAGTAMSNQRLLKRFKKRHVTLNGFKFIQAKDKVHIENYDELWEVLYKKIIIRIVAAIAYDGCEG